MQMPLGARAPRRGRVVWTVYAVLGVVLVAYLASLLVRGTGGSNQLIDGWAVAAFEIIGSGLCLARARWTSGRRVVPLLFGLATLSWAIGDVLLTLEGAGATVDGASPADAFYLGFYPLAYAGLVCFVRQRVRNLSPAMWLDGVIAGLGAAGLCACFAFASIVTSTGGDAGRTAVDLAYPVGDLLLLALIVGGSAILPTWRNPQWTLLAVACAANALGDTANLFANGIGSGTAGTIANGVAWPTAILLISLSVWLPSGRRDTGAVHKPPGHLLPALGGVAGVAILLFGSLHAVTIVAIVLATAVLVTVGVRLWLSLGHLRTLTHKRHRQAVTDDLTGLGNRRQLFYLLDDFFGAAGCDDAPPLHLGLLFIDLDHFKEINDSFGHAAGDQLLRQLGPRLKGSLRASDLLVRVGGDELAVVIVGADTAYAAGVAQRLISALQQPFALDTVSVRIGASIGIASAPGDAVDGAGLLRCADLAMYRAKQRDSKYAVFRKDIDDDGSRLRLVEELRSSVNEGRLLLHFQPQIDLSTGNVVAVEALLRWPNPRLGMVPPLDFLPLAEEAGLMAALTEWVVEAAVAQASDWRRHQQGLAVSINVSISNLLDPAFIGFVRSALSRHHLAPSAVNLEVTETTIISDFNGCRQAISDLRELGVGVSIDDFGAGFTSLAYLSGLAITELKLDRTFITRLGVEGEVRDVTLVRATIELGHALGLRVVAEGVEDSETLRLLSDLGCDLAQGYHIGTPVPASEISFVPVGLVERALGAGKPAAA